MNETRRAFSSENNCALLKARRDDIAREAAAVSSLFYLSLRENGTRVWEDLVLLFSSLFTRQGLFFFVRALFVDTGTFIAHEAYLLL